jgi:hypothetical protein
VEHGVPLLSSEWTHPATGSQESAVQSFLSSQVESSVWQTPEAQNPTLVHGSESSHTVPLGAGDQSICESVGAQVLQPEISPTPRHAPWMKQTSFAISH